MKEKYTIISKSGKLIIEAESRSEAAKQFVASVDFDNSTGFKVKAPHDGVGSSHKFVTAELLSEISDKSGTEKKSENTQQTSSAEDTYTTLGKGSYSFYDFSYTRDGTQYAVVFTPLLPRDDPTVIGAMLEVINKIYGKQKISERHRHRYEVNIKYRQVLEGSGLYFSGLSPDGILPEIVEYANHPWFVGVQFHPELKSRPFKPHPLFISFIKAASNHSKF